MTNPSVPAAFRAAHTLPTVLRCKRWQRYVLVNPNANACNGLNSGASDDCSRVQRAPLKRQRRPGQLPGSRVDRRSSLGESPVADGVRAGMLPLRADVVSAALDGLTVSRS